MIDYKFKVQVMEQGFVSLQKNVSKSLYAQEALHRWGLVCNHKYSFEKADEINEDMTKHCFKEWHEAFNINNAEYKRVKRMKDKLSYMLNNGKCIFLTFTFTDKVLSSTSKNSRRRYVVRFLTDLQCNYVGNIDYGAKKGREHYHAVVQIDKVKYTSWKYGALNGKKVVSTNDSVKLAKYISKLTNHAIKATVRGNRALYNRKLF